MTMKEIMRQYFMGELDAISVIRMLSGMFDPKNAVSLLTLICTIARHEQGDIDTETFNEIWKFGIDLKFNKGDYPTEYDTMPMQALKKELENLQKRQKRSAPTNLEEHSDETAIEHDISLLISYLIYRERKNEKEASKEKTEKELETTKGVPL